MDPVIIQVLSGLAGIAVGAVLLVIICQDYLD